MNQYIPFNSPEEFARHLQEQHEQHHLRQQDIVHQVNDLLAKLNKDELNLLDQILAGTMNDPHYVGYMRGQINTVLEYDHDICRCGRNHEAELDEALIEHGGSEDKPESIPETPDPHTGADPLHLMEQYQIEKVPDDLQSEYPTEFRCSNCLTPIVSLQDRMLREPGIGGCSGCQTYSSQGVKWHGR